MFPKVIWGDVWIEDKKLGLFHMRACYDRAKQTIILDCADTYRLKQPHNSFNQPSCVKDKCLLENIENNGNAKLTMQ